VHIFRRTKTTYFSSAQNHIFFVGPKVHIFRRTKTTYFSSAQNHIFFAGPKSHIFRRPQSAYFSSAPNHIFFVGPKVHIFRRSKPTYFSSGPKCIFFAGAGGGSQQVAGGSHRFAVTVSQFCPLVLNSLPFCHNSPLSKYLIAPFPEEIPPTYHYQLSRVRS
jgi:hypothetical protein